jgi:PAS domain S-box-containing protein
MRVESVSIKSVTVAIFTMIAAVAIILSLLAGSYFRQSALAAQVGSLSRVLEVAAQEMQQKLRDHTFDVGMKLAHSNKLIRAFNTAVESGRDEALVGQLDDPFTTGFVGFSDINLVKLRVYDSALEFVGESTLGIQGLENRLPGYLETTISKRPPKDRLKTVDALWLSSERPLFSAVVPLGGLRPVGYLEVIADPAFNLPEIARITGTAVSSYSMTGELVSAVEQGDPQVYLPVEYVLHTTDGVPAFRIVGLENVAKLSADMMRTQSITITGFLLLSLGTLLVAMWLFNRFMLSPVSAMVRNMRLMANGRLDMAINNRGLREFHVLADAFNTMANMVRMRTNDLERLLDMDDSAILCFDHDSEIVFFNKAVAPMFGYSDDELGDLDMAELFTGDISAMMAGRDTDQRPENKLHRVVTCRSKDGGEFRCDAVINALDVMGQRGLAIALNTVTGDERTLSRQSEQRLDAVEHSLTSLLEFASSNPSLVLSSGHLPDAAGSATVAEKALIREESVRLMNLALACWERGFGKSKLDLAEESGIWPVYIDKSTPTTRTLDKYLNLDLCPKNPRSKRVVDTAEFVLRHVDTDSPGCDKLEQGLETYRMLVSGVKAKAAGHAL